MKTKTTSLLAIMLLIIMSACNSHDPKFPKVHEKICIKIEEVPNFSREDWRSGTLEKGFKVTCEGFYDFPNVPGWEFKEKIVFLDLKPDMSGQDAKFEETNFFELYDDTGYPHVLRLKIVSYDEMKKASTLEIELFAINNVQSYGELKHDFSSNSDHIVATVSITVKVKNTIMVTDGYASELHVSR